jgi:Mn-containing catalase
MDCRLSENTGELDVDLRSNIAAEARAKIVYEGLRAGGGKHGQTSFHHWSHRADTWLGRPFFNDSTGTGEHGEIDARGPWNEGNGWVFTDSPRFTPTPALQVRS